MKLQLQMHHHQQQQQQQQQQQRHSNPYLQRSPRMDSSEQRPPLSPSQVSDDEVQNVRQRVLRQRQQLRENQRLEMGEQQEW